jgi:glycosyltransferase involved in cell wall biosynthesis
MVTTVNGRFLTQPLTGVQTYAIRFSSYLYENWEDVQWIVQHTDHIHITLPLIQTGRLKGHAWEQISLPIHLKKIGSPLLINFGNTAPANYSNQLVTIHDLGFIKHPEGYSTWFTIYYRALIPVLIRKNKKIITVSETIANEIQQFYGIKDHQIEVIYNTAEINTSRLPKENFILSVGSIQPRKNYRKMYEIFLHCDEKYRWVIVGSSHSIFRHDDELLQLLNTHPRIELIENISDEKLNQYYAQALLLMTASKYEGCNLPVLEAIQHGLPVFISDIPVHRELYEAHADFFSLDDSPGDIAKRINQLINSGSSVLPIEKFTIQEQGKKLISLVAQYN